MTLTFTARTGVSLIHESTVEDTLRLVRQLELGDDLDLDIAIGVRDGHPDQSALVDGLRGRGAVLPIDPACSVTEAHNRALARMVDKGNQFAWILSHELLLEPRTLGVLTKHMRVVPDCAVVSPYVTRSDAPKRKAVDVDAGHWVGSLYRTAALERIGLFDDGDVVEGHDVGWSGRARGAGWRVMTHRKARLTLASVHE